MQCAWLQFAVISGVPMKRVLIVDDTKATRHDAESVIRALGYETIMASSGKDGLAFLKNNRVDLCIVVNEMTGMTGLQMIDRLRTRNDNTPVIIITSVLPEIPKSTEERLNVSDYLNKNLHSDRARRVIVHTLGDRLPEESAMVYG